MRYFIGIGVNHEFRPPLTSSHQEGLSNKKVMLSQALAWAVFWGGILVIVVFAKYATAGSQSNFLFGFSEPCKGSPWIQGLLGQRVRLPDNDAQGFPITHKKQFAISLNCSSCGSKSDLRKALRIAYIKPVLVFVTGDLRELSRE